MKLSKKAQTSLNKVIDKFKTGDISPLSNVMKIRLDDDAPASKWSFGNQVLAYAQKGNLDCRGYRQWETFGRNVAKGSSAAFILTPKTIKKQKDNGDDYFKLIGFSSVAVFSAEDTEGETPLPNYEPAELPPLVDVAKRLGIEVEWLPTGPKCLGTYYAHKDKINVGTDNTSVFFHELAHAIHNRIEPLKNEGKNYKETVAELTASVLMDMYGEDTTGNCWEYISSYNADPLKAITQALSMVGKVLDILFEDTNDEVSA